MGMILSLGYRTLEKSSFLFFLLGESLFEKNINTEIFYLPIRKILIDSILNDLLNDFTLQCFELGRSKRIPVSKTSPYQKSNNLCKSHNKNPPKNG